MVVFNVHRFALCIRHCLVGHCLFHVPSL